MKSWGGGAGGGGGWAGIRVSGARSSCMQDFACACGSPCKPNPSRSLFSLSLLSPSLPLSLSLSLSLFLSVCIHRSYIHRHIPPVYTHTLIACFHGSKGRRAFATCVSPTMDDEPLLDLEDVYRCLGFNESRCPHRPSMMHTDPKGPST